MGESRTDSTSEVMVFRESGKDSVLEHSWCGINTGGRQAAAIIILNI